MAAKKPAPVTWWEEIKRHKRAISVAAAFLIVARILYGLSGTYADSVETAPVPDLLLDRLPVIDLSIFFVWVWGLAVLLIVLYPLAFDVRRFHVVVIQFSLLVMIRAAFTTLTHLQAPADAIVARFPWPFTDMLYRNDLFFSGHVALMFLGFLLFDGWIKWTSLALSVAMAATVLLMHVHYTIDVAAAFFIAYGSYRIGERLLERINGYTH